MRVSGLGFRRAESGRSRRGRRLLSVCLAALLFSADAAPHRHKNDIADLLGDGPSDSGVFIDVSLTPARGDPPIAESVRYIDDDPCLACLPSDFATTAAESAAPSHALFSMGRQLSILTESDRFVSPRLHASRSPPRA